MKAASRFAQPTDQPESPVRPPFPAHYRALLSLILLPSFLLPLQAQSALEEARAAIQSGDWHKARQHYEEVLRSGSNLGEAHYYLAQIAARTLTGPESEREVIEHFQLALEQRTSDPVILAEYARWLLEQHYMEEALLRYQALVELQPDQPESRNMLGLVHYNRRDPARALEIFQAVLRTAPGNLNALLYAGMASRALNRLEEAETYFRRGLALEQSVTELRLQLGLLLVETDRAQESLSFFQGLEMPQADYGRGVALFKLERWEESLATLQRLLSKEPNHTQGHYQLGRLYARLGEREKSRSHFQQFRQLEAQDREAKRFRESKEIVRTPQ